MTVRRATRHNGRKGKMGVFKAGHNDRTFNTDNAEHIDTSRSGMNVYWDCYQGFNVPDENGIRPERKYSFEQVELAYYNQQFGDSMDYVVEINGIAIIIDVTSAPYRKELLRQYYDELCGNNYSASDIAA